MQNAFTSFHTLWTQLPTLNGRESGKDNPVRDWTGRLKKGRLLTGGGYGDVFMGEWHSLPLTETQTVPAVVVKVLQQRSILQNQKRSVKIFNREVRICLRLRHDNIVPFIGVVFGFGEREDLPALVSLYMSNGTVKAYLETRIILDIRPLLLDIARGIEYLHTFDPNIVHGDIKAENILVDNESHLRVADFGLSRMLVDQSEWVTTAQQAGGSLRWMAPELFMDEPVVTMQSDVYALSLTFLEIVTLEFPFSRYKSTGSLIAAILVRNETPARPIVIEDGFWDLLTAYWERDPTARPNIQEILKRLENHQLSLQRPITDWTGQLEQGEYIAGGLFADFYYGEWISAAANPHDSREVVLKTEYTPPSDENPSIAPKRLKRIRQELEIGSRINHPNIVGFLGVVFINANFPSLVFELASEGPFREYIQSHSKQQITLEPFLADVANAVCYLHSLSPKIIHGNIKGDSLMVKGDGTLCLGGFALSHMEGDVPYQIVYGWSSGNLQFSVRWSAPERIDADTAPTTQSDIYSFAMTVIEVVTDNVPFRSIKNSAGVVKAVLVENARPNRPQEKAMTDWLWDLVCQCWQTNPQDRPTAQKVVQIFEAARARGWADITT